MNCVTKTLHIFLVLCSIATSAFAVDVQIPASRDNTMWEGNGNRSSGSGPNLWAGKNSLQTFRRCAVFFHLAPFIPSEATITSAVLRLSVDKTPNQPEFVHAVHRLTRDWGEGSSDSSSGGAFAGGGGTQANNNDMTRTHNFWPASTWAIDGGDFVGVASASTLVGGPVLGDLTPSFYWSSSQTVVDVQEWLDVPSTNFGWIVVGDEGPVISVKRFISRESNITNRRPTLLVGFVTLTSTTSTSTLTSSTSTTSTTSTTSIVSSTTSTSASTSTTTQITTTTSTSSPFVNMIPYAEPFENLPPYANGFSIDGTNGWVGIPGAAVISSNDVLNTALGNLEDSGVPLPISGVHTKVLCITPDQLPFARPRVPMRISNKVNGNASTMYIDFLWWPRLGAEPKMITTNVQAAFYPNFSGRLVIWHDDAGAPEWHPLTNSPIISTGKWVRVTMEKNYTYARWRFRVNGQNYISDAKGWNTPEGSSHPGEWFDMVQKGLSISRLGFEGESYIDDVVVQSMNPFPTTSTLTSSTSTTSTSTTSTTTLLSPMIVKMDADVTLWAVYSPTGLVPMYATNLKVTPIEWMPISIYSNFSLGGTNILKFEPPDTNAAAIYFQLWSQ